MIPWREIPMTGIDWSALKPQIGRSASTLRMLSHGFDDFAPKPGGAGCWRDMTLGDVADLGKYRLINHHHLFGEKTLAALQTVIDLAAAGRLPLKQAPARDALRPTSEHGP